MPLMKVGHEAGILRPKGKEGPHHMTWITSSCLASPSSIIILPSILQDVLKFTSKRVLSSVQAQITHRRAYRQASPSSRNFDNLREETRSRKAKQTLGVLEEHSSRSTWSILRQLSTKARQQHWAGPRVMDHIALNFALFKNGGVCCRNF